MPNGLPFSERAFDTAEDGATTVVTEATTLTPSQRNVDVVIPLASADTYAITLPPVGHCNGMRFCFYARRTTGVYVDGGVTVQDQNDNWITDFTSDAMTATGDYVIVENVAGKFWIIPATLTGAAFEVTST